MSGVASIALGTAPVVGGALLGVAAGQLKAPDYRGLIKQDMDLLDRLPPEATARRADVQRTIDADIDRVLPVHATPPGSTLPIVPGWVFHLPPNLGDSRHVTEPSEQCWSGSLSGWICRQGMDSGVLKK